MRWPEEGQMETRVWVGTREDKRSLLLASFTMKKEGVTLGGKRKGFPKGGSKRGKEKQTEILFQHYLRGLKERDREKPDG